MRASTNSARPGRVIALTLALLVATQLSACGRTLSPRAAPDLAGQQSAAQHSVYFTAGKICALSHSHFEHAQAKVGLREPLAMLEETGAGIYFLEPYDPKRIPVLFVHGAGGRPRDFRNMIETLDRSRFQVWVFHYPTGLRLPFVARILRGLVEDLRSKLQRNPLFP